MTRVPDGPARFAARAAAALDDSALRGALDRATSQLGRRRAEAFLSLEDPDAARDHARAARMRVLGHLAESLERFEARLVANGAHVHWAEDSDDATRIVTSIAARTGARRVVKSKSMATEEIHLNPALERAGVQVLETDLGEYIVQLAGDRPSHIIAPIVHLTRQDVGRLMHQKLGVPYTDDPQALAAAARERLREAFAAADLGVTGANFGVVETGAICLVTNEGNGRMVTALPPVHVVVMGIEKLVTSMADLDACLKVLARSATGQKLSVYTTIVHGPGRGHETDGPDELHVVLVDNGRSGTLAGETAEILGCIRCGACLNICPVYRSIGGHAYGDTYAGPVGAVLTPALRGLREWGELAGASSLCGACRDICPVRLDIPRMLLAVRHAHTSDRAPRWMTLAMTAYAWAASRPPVYRLGMRVARWAMRLRAKGGWIRDAGGLARGWTTSRDLPAPATTTFQALWRARQRNRREHRP